MLRAREVATFRLIGGSIGCANDPGRDGCRHARCCPDRGGLYPHGGGGSASTRAKARVSDVPGNADAVTTIGERCDPVETMARAS